jgi:peptide/nickel transport system substrate-binding protein
MFLAAPMGTHSARRRWTTTAIAAAAAAALLLSGCTAKGNSPSRTADSTLVVYTGQAGDYQINFNPYSPSSIGGIGSIYESLFFVTNVNTNPYEPLLGTAYTWNADGTQLDVTLRDGVKWSDGEAFTAKDVVFTFKMLLDTPAINTGGFNGTVKANSDTSVTFTWEKSAFVSGPEVLGRTPIVPEHQWANIDPGANQMEKPVGTGAYTLGDFKPQAFTLSANPGYWGGEPAVKAVRFLSLSGNTAGADALAAGRIDWQTGPVPDIQNVSKNYPGYQAISIPLNQASLLTCSNAELGCAGPQTDPAVRQAIYRALDRGQVDSLAFQGTAEDISPTFALLGAQDKQISSSIKEAVAPNTPDVATAKSLLEGAGWTMGSNGLYEKNGAPLQLTVEVVTGWTDYITAIDTMSQQLKAAGIGLAPAQSSWNEWTDKKSKGNYQLAIDSLGQGPVSDPYFLYNNYFSTANTAAVGQAAPVNMSRFSDPEVDAALAILKTTSPDDKEARQKQFDIIQKKVVEVMPYIPILTGATVSEFNSKKFTGWPSKDDLYAFPAIWASPDNSQIFKKLVPTGK